MAQKFHFKLDVVERLRKKELDEKRREVADAVRAVTAAQRRLESVNDSLKGNLKLSRDQQTTQRLDLHGLRQNRYHQTWLHRKLIEANQTLMDSSTDLQQRRRELGQVNARYKAIVKLREKQWDRYQKQLARQQRIEFDEIAVQQFWRLAVQMKLADSTVYEVSIA